MVTKGVPRGNEILQHACAIEPAARAAGYRLTGQGLLWSGMPRGFRRRLGKAGSKSRARHIAGYRLSPKRNARPKRLAISWFV